MTGIRLFLCGDAMLGRGIDQILAHPGNPELCEAHAKSAVDYIYLAEALHGHIPRHVTPPYVWGEALGELETARPAARTVNLETAITIHDQAAPKGIEGYEEFRPDLALMYLPELDSVTGHLVSLEIIPMQICRFRLNRTTASDTAWLHRTLAAASAGLGTSITLSAQGHLVIATEGTQTMRLTSSAFAHNKSIPERFTCDGSNVSPPLEWSEPPAGTRSFALVCSDPDAPGGLWYHWAIYDIPPSTRALPEHWSHALPGVPQGRNDFGLVGYNGPCPPRGKPHRYVFKLYALKAEGLGLGPGARCREVEAAAGTLALVTAELVGRYKRPGG